MLLARSSWEGWWKRWEVTRWMMAEWLVTAAVPQCDSRLGCGICWPAGMAAGGEGSIQARVELEMI